MNFSARTQWETQQNPLYKALASLRESGKEILDLTLSNPTRAGFKYLDKALLSAFLRDENLIYEPDPKGLLSARECVARYYAQRNIKTDPDDIFLTASTSEGYLFLLRLFADPGDEVYIPKPSYPLFDYLCGLSDAEIRPYSLVLENNAWRIGTDSLSGPAGRAKALVVVNPNNPTGNYVQPHEAAFLERFCAERRAALIVDEVFWDYPLGTAARLSFAGRENTLTFTLSGLSKIAGLPQMKLSWIVVSGPDAEKKEAMRRLEIISDTMLSVNTPVQNALSSWDGLRVSAMNEIIRRLENNYAYFSGKIRGSRLSRGGPEGGWYVTMALPSSLTDEDCALSLLEKRSVYTHPGFLFDFSDTERLVLSLLPEERVFREGLDRIFEALKNA